MLESLAATLLNRILGSYVENFDPTQLNLGIWSGNVRLTNLKLRKDSLDGLSLPVDVKFGVLGELLLTVPWSSLKNKPVKISIEDCYLLCTPRDNASMHSEEQIERDLRVKLHKLAEWELANQARSAAENPNGQGNENESFMQSLMTKIVDNLQVTIKNIHVRYEDMSQVLSKGPCSIGITLSELSAVSTDAGWTPSFISMTQDVTHKLVTLNSLCLYWNTKAVTIEEEDDILDHDILISKFKNAVATGGKAIPSFQYILKPVTGSGRLSVNKLGSTPERPHIELNVLFDELGFELDDSEYADILHTISSLHLSQKTQKFKKKRPDYSTNENPSGWFKYVASCVLDEIHEKNEAWTWDHIKQRCEQRRLYIQLWMKKLQQGNIDQKLPSQEDEKKLDELHRVLDFDSLILFRSVAKKEYAKKRLTTRDAASSIPQQQTSGPGGWLSSWWGGGKDTNNKAEDLLLTDEQRQELYDAIEFDESNEIETQIPKDRTTVKITGLLKKGAFTIKNRAHCTQLGEIIFQNCELEFLQRTGSFLASFKLHEFKIEDGSPNTLYKHIVSVKNIKSDDLVDAEGNPEPLLKALFESNPLDESADSKVDITLRGMTIFYHVHFINEIIHFFNPPKQHMETITAIINAAEATVEGWTTQTRMGLESLLEEHKTANITLDLQAPLIIIPLDPHVWDTPCAVIDAGHIALVSDLVPKQRIEQIRQMSPEEYDKIDDLELKGLMFDRFQLYLQDTQILVGPDVRSTISSLNGSAEGVQYSILSGLLLELTLDISILPRAYNLPRAKAFGHLQKLDLSLNDYQYKVIMQLLEKSIPNFTDFESDIDFKEQYATMGNEDKKLQIQLKNTMQALEKMTPAQIAQKLFQLQFEVDSIQISLYKCLDNGSMSCKKLLDFLGDKVKLILVKKAKEIEMKLNVHSVSVMDFIEQTNNDEFRYLISSGAAEPDKEKDLFTVDYNRKQRIVLHDDLHIEVFDQDVNINMEQLRVVLTPKSILTLMNFALTTFTDPSTPEVPADVLRHNRENREDAPQKINLAVDMAGIVIIFNDDSLKLATLVLSAGEFTMFLLPEKMKVNMRLGGLELTDEVSGGLPRDSIFRRVITMSDAELAELTYETFDPANNPNNYDSVLKYTTGSLHINFIEHSINKLVNFFYKLQKLKKLFDKARELAYDQAPSIESVNNLKMDILIKAPIIEFPKLIDPRNDIYDSMKFYLGEFFIQNEFHDLADSHKVNHIKLGLREGQLLSNFSLENGDHQLLHMIDNMCLTFDVEHDQMAALTYPEFKIKGYFDPLKTSLTELQLRYLVSISEKVTAAFDITEPTSEELGGDEIYADTFGESAVASTNLGSPSPVDVESDQKQLEGLKLDFQFEAPEVSLTLFNDTAKATKLDKKGLTVLTFHDLALKAKYNNDGTGEAESHIATFAVVDIRDKKDNKHTELIPKVVNENYQFMSSITAKNLSEGKLINLSVTIDSPQIILAMDYLFALQHFCDLAFTSQSAQVEIDTPGYGDLNAAPTNMGTLGSETKLHYSLNVVNAAVILLADPSDLKSEAVVFNVGQFLLSDQNITALSANNVGMSFVRMNSDSEQRVRLLDEFSSSIVIDKRNSTPERLLTNVQVSVEPLILSISLRDIRLAMLIFNRLMSQMSDGSNAASANDEVSTYGAFSKEFEKKLSRYAPSFVSSLNASSHHDVRRATQVDIVTRGEKLEADFGGLRLLLIGDVHELPILDMNVNPFQASAKNWSTDIDALATLETYVNVFNYSRSSWEPLIEEFPISFHLSKGSERDALIRFDAVSRKVAELTLSSRTIAMLSQIPSTLTGDINISSRGAQKPYRIINDTEFDLEIWIATDDGEERRGFTTLKARGTIPWEFEDWRTVREKLDVDSKGCNLAAVVAGSNYKTTMKIDATQEGEFLFVLQPAVNHVHNRLTCELQLGDDNVKVITFRSTLVMENATSIPVLLKVESHDLEPVISAIDPSKTHSVPVSYSYDSKLRIKPSTEEDYDWSEQVISWRDLLKSSLSVECRSISDPNRKFYLEVNGKFDAKEPLAKIYPRMKIIVSPPLVIENLLSSDLKFTLYDKRQEHRNLTLLKKSSRVPIHDVSLDNFLLLSIQPLVDDAPLSKPSIVNTAARSSLKPETQITTKLAGVQTFRAALHYQTVEGTRAKILKISAPYIIFNRTDKDLYIQGDRTNIAQIKVQTSGSQHYTAPKMFSFETDGHNKNRASIRFKESDWSLPLSFDAIGQSLDAVVNIPNKEQESNLGVTISEGEGQYVFSKIVEIAPRYIIHNCLNLPIEICELGSTNVSQLDADHTKPLYKMRNIVNKQLMIKFLGVNCDWSAPFFIKDIGLTYLKVLKQDSTHMLLKVEIILENATVFIRLKDANNRWPYSIRNFSDQEFIFYQRDPRVIDDYYDYDSFDELDEIEYKPLYYRLPPKSVMPYAWDYPAARQKKIVITARGLRREIQLAEIGNLKPMRLPAKLANEDTITVDLNVVADGPTQALVITKYNPAVSLYKLRSKKTSSSLSVNSSADGFEAEEEDKNFQKKIMVSLKGVGISLINASLQEILYVYANGLELRYNESDLYQTFSWKLKWVQIDNQLFSSPFENVMYPATVLNTAQEVENHPVISGSISKVKDDSHGLKYFKHATLLLQELSIQLDEELLISLLDFGKFPGAVWNKYATQTHYSDTITLPECKDIKFAEDMYFEIFHVQPMLLHISFVRSDQHNFLESEQNRLGLESGGAILFLIDMLTMTLANVNDAPIKLNSLYMANVRVPIDTLLQAVQTHYGQQFFYQIHKILGSADFLGNPVGLFNTISSGVWDIFYEPYQGYMMNDRPQELGIHLAKGGLSFAKKTVFGLSDSMAKFTGSMAKGLSFTQDQEFQEKRRLQQRMNANRRSLISSSAQTFVNTVGSGFTGMALDPMNGAQKEGAAGFIKGLGKGLFGLPTKTAIGFLDLTSNLSQGVKSTASALDGPSSMRVRLPRYVDYHEKIIRPFNLMDAQGQYWLKSLDGGLFMNDNYLTHVVLPGRELAVLVSMEHIIEMNIASQETMWVTDYYGIQGIILQRGGIHIRLKSKSEYFIPISDTQERKHMYKHIAIAVTEFNKYCEATL
ncbi:hypothetical protein HG536_0A01750 [Torulaspora globosa]|uniref:Vacuolar protein sorting-associated protein n=1 Tax=Torulaspora globosa TaxID=48254 RepID=A0A7G3ZA22_9SACH|nr:uncharacterized protein HG536_0A01750 [Torulaspora globosa]QLL30358.1 hypothetical protein HG536_0A01750 [Torulaspora globosa]